MPKKVPVKVSTEGKSDFSEGARLLRQSIDEIYHELDLDHFDADFFYQRLHRYFQSACQTDMEADARTRDAAGFLEANVHSALDTMLTILSGLAVYAPLQAAWRSTTADPSQIVPLKASLRKFADQGIDKFIDSLSFDWKRGRPEEWSKEVLQNAVLEAAGRIQRTSLRTYASVGKRMTPPVEKDALEKLIERKGLRPWWRAEIKGIKKQKPTKSQRK